MCENHWVRWHRWAKAKGHSPLSRAGEAGEGETRRRGEAAREAETAAAYRHFKLMRQARIVQALCWLPAGVRDAHACPVDEVALSTLKTLLRQDAIGGAVRHVLRSAAGGRLLGLLVIGKARLHELPILPLLLEVLNGPRVHGLGGLPLGVGIPWPLHQVFGAAAAPPLAKDALLAGRSSITAWGCHSLLHWRRLWSIKAGLVNHSGFGNIDPQRVALALGRRVLAVWQDDGSRYRRGYRGYTQPLCRRHAVVNC